MHAIVTPRRIHPRLAYALATATTVVLGLASRRFASELPAPVGNFVAAYVGDSLWAAMVFLGASTGFPHVAMRSRVAISLAYCFATELSQLYHAPWIDGLRATRLGGLVLGFGFLWSDLVAYIVGVLGAAVLARAVIRYAACRHTAARTSRAR